MTAVLTLILPEAVCRRCGVTQAMRPQFLRPCEEGQVLPGWGLTDSEGRKWVLSAQLPSGWAQLDRQPQHALCASCDQALHAAVDAFLAEEGPVMVLPVPTLQMPVAPPASPIPMALPSSARQGAIPSAARPIGPVVVSQPIVVQAAHRPVPQPAPQKVQVTATVPTPPRGEVAPLPKILPSG